MAGGVLHPNYPTRTSKGMDWSGMEKRSSTGRN
jgi:hypothetical protein